MGSAKHIYVAVVDDDESLCRSFARLLRAAGLQPITYASAEALLEDRKRPQFACLVLDVQLCGMSGIALHQELSQAGSGVPIIFITAHDDLNSRRQAEVQGCAGYFRKTDSGEQVLKGIRDAVHL